MPLWIAEADVAALLDMGDAIRALEDGLRRAAAGEALDMAKTHVAWDAATLHALGAAVPAAGLAGTKTWVHTPAGATPLLVLFNTANGRLEAIVEAFALGQLRTGAASGVATTYLAAPDADELAMIGTGKQALPQVAAIVAVRPIRTVRLVGRDTARRAAAAAEIRRCLDVAVVEHDEVAAAVRDAPIITLATRATTPFLDSAMVAPGAHINAIGAIVPTGAELATDVLARASRLVVDSLAQARRLSQELRTYLGDDEAAWARVETLAAVVAGERRRRTATEVTIFKSFGMGLSDVVLGAEVYRRAVAAGRGRAVPHPERVALRVRVAARPERT